MQPLMPKATAVWLVDNTTLSFDQIAEFVGLHPLEVSGIADGEVAVGIKGFDPVTNHQLAREEIERCEKDPKQRLKLMKPISTPPQKKKAPRYTPLSKRQDRPAAIAWLVRNHPELADAQISKLLGTTKQTIQAIRDKSHWNSGNIQPVDPVALGLCRQVDLDAAVQLAAERKAKQGGDEQAGGRLMPTEESLADDRPARTVKGFEDIEQFALNAGEDSGEQDDKDTDIDADSLFNLPEGADEEDEADAKS